MSAPEDLPGDEDPEALFKRYLCSWFRICHDAPERVDWYRGLEVPSSVERQWIRELFDERARGILYLIGADSEQRLLDPSVSDVASAIQSLEWRQATALDIPRPTVTLQLLPAGQLRIDTIMIEKGGVLDDAPATPQFSVTWRHAKDGFSFIAARVDSPGCITKILTAAMDNDEAGLRRAAAWKWPPALRKRSSLLARLWRFCTSKWR